MVTIFGSLGHDTQMGGSVTLPDPNPTITANTLPLVVPMLPVYTNPGAATSINNGGVVTTPASVSTTPAQVGSSTQFSLGAYLLDVVEHPFTHWIAAIVLLLIVLWIYRHFLKGLFR